MDVSIIGAGYVGLVTGLCLADAGHRVTCVDVDVSKIGRLSAGILPIYEAGLDTLLERNLGTRFFPTTNLTHSVQESELTMIAVGTPLENGAINLRFIMDAAAQIGSALATTLHYHVVVVKSTVVPGTTEDVVGRLIEESSGKKCGRDFGLGMNPEFLREGEAVSDFQNPDRIVLGAIDAHSLDVMNRLYKSFEGTERVETNPRTAEMIKYASNALLATLISFSNEIGNLCAMAPGVDSVDVLGAVQLDKRISPIGSDGVRVTPAITSYLRAGCGFGGSCFPKDVRALIHWAEEKNRPARLLHAVLAINEDQSNEVVALLKKARLVLAGQRVAVLGLAFKAGTDDIRESPALRVVPALVAEGADVVAYDPIAVAPAKEALAQYPVKYAESLEDAIEGASAIVLLTAWPEFQEIPTILDRLANPPVVVDGRRALDKKRMKRYEGIGLGASSSSAPGGGSLQWLAGVESPTAVNGSGTGL